MDRQSSEQETHMLNPSSEHRNSKQKIMKTATQQKQGPCKKRKHKTYAINQGRYCIHKTKQNKNLFLKGFSENKKCPHKLKM